MRYISRAASIVLIASQRNRLTAAFAPVAISKSATLSRSDDTRKTQLYSSERDMAHAGFVHEDPASKRRKRDQSSLLSAVAIDAPLYDSGFEVESLCSTIQPVLSTALLITGNTVGASCLVLPEMAAQPGMGTSTLLFVASYLANLLSGLIIAEVAIKQHDSSGQDVPSSFKEFADENLDIPIAGTLIACISLFVNACIMSFDLTRAGHIVSDLFGGVDPFAMSVGFGALVASLASTQTAKNLSSFASVAVTALFISFAGLLIPGLANVHDPLTVFMTPGTSSDFMSSVSQAAPIILMTCVYQNIVPSVTKILNYNRTRVVASMVLGSGIPLCMFLAWCYASIGGGIDTSMGAAGPLLTAFSLSAVSGSSIGTVMSISEELDSVFTATITEKKESDRFSVPTVLLAVAAPLAVAYVVGGDSISTVLQLAGGYGTPLLYGAIPVTMAWTQRNKLPRKENLVPGGAVTLGGLGVGAMAFLGQELFQDISGAFASVVC